MEQLIGMAKGGEVRLVLSLTPEEAGELLSRCLNSTEDDNPEFQAVLQKLASLVSTEFDQRAA